MKTYLNKKELIDLLSQENLYTQLTKKAFEQAEASHGDQKRDAGEPYLEEHVYPIVEDLIQSRVANEKIVVAALLHDAVEDDDSFSETDCIENFGQAIFDIIEPLTKAPRDNVKNLSEKEKMEINRQCLEKIAKSSKESILIKLADRKNNILCTNKIRYSNPQKYERYIQETEELFLPFAKSNSDYFYRAIKEILHELKEY